MWNWESKITQKLIYYCSYKPCAPVRLSAINVCTHFRWSVEQFKAYTRWTCLEWSSNTNWKSPSSGKFIEFKVNWTVCLMYGDKKQKITSFILNSNYMYHSQTKCVTKGQNVSVWDYLISQEFSCNFEPVLSIPCSQQPAILSYPGRDQSNPHCNTQRVAAIFTTVIYEYFLFVLKKIFLWAINFYWITPW
jgi:hypothetical protein